MSLNVAPELATHLAKEKRLCLITYALDGTPVTFPAYDTHCLRYSGIGSGFPSENVGVKLK